jgi:hypothetical protein
MNKNVINMIASWEDRTSNNQLRLIKINKPHFKSTKILLNNLIYDLQLFLQLNP